MNNRQNYINNVLQNNTKYARKQNIKRIYKEVHGVLPQIYAAFALTLSYERYKWTPEQIEELFEETMALWEDCERNGVNMCEWCEKETGIDVEEKKY